ncbi:MAG: hypothetical protein N7Q72_01550 [Spiroplasma sp. Tabriz.8]|nr:hypothetical protein [Spiroplasma sp. Tabriz.8]
MHTRIYIYIIGRKRKRKRKRKNLMKKDILILLSLPWFDSFLFILIDH